MVATPSATSSSTAGRRIGHGRSLADGSGAEAAGDEAVRSGLEPGRLASANRSAAARPGQSSGSSAVGQAGVGEEELAPLVHEVEAGRERRLVLVVVGVRGAGRPGRRRSSATRRTPCAGASRSQAPVGAGSNRSARAVRARGAGPLEDRRELGAREGADPDVVGQLGVADEGQVGAEPGAGGPAGGRVDEGELPACRPSSAGAGGRRGRRRRRGGGWRARWSGSRARRRAGPARASPA